MDRWQGVTGRGASKCVWAVWSGARAKDCWEREWAGFEEAMKETESAWAERLKGASGRGW